MVRAKLGSVRDAELRQELRQLTTRVRSHGRLLATNRITPAQWEQRMRDDLAIGHNRALAMEQDTGVPPAWYRQLLTDEYAFLSAFRASWETGEMSQTQLLNRSGRYSSAIVLTRSAARHQKRIDEGYNEARRWLDVQANYVHCNDCIQYARAGWQAAEDTPPPGWACKCRNSCRCGIEYRGLSLSSRLPTMPIQTLRDRSPQPESIPRAARAAANRQARSAGASYAPMGRGSRSGGGDYAPAGRGDRSSGGTVEPNASGGGSI